MFLYWSAGYWSGRSGLACWEAEKITRIPTISDVHPMTARFALSNAEQRYRSDLRPIPMLLMPIPKAMAMPMAMAIAIEAADTSDHKRSYAVTYIVEERVCVRSTPDIVARNEIVLHYRQIN